MMGNLRYWVFVLTLVISACGTTQTQIPVVPSVTDSATETPIPPTSTPDYIIVIITATPEPPLPFLVQDCFDAALTQMDLNNCAALEIRLANEELDEVVAQIKFSSEEKLAFDKLQSDWKAQVEKDCKFFYGQLLTENDGSLRYKRGSMAPMLWGLCIAEQYKRRIEDLKYAYLNFP